MVGRIGKGAPVEAVASRRYWRADDARAVVEAWRRSGKPLSEFAADVDVLPRRVARWAGRLEAGEATAAEVDFHPVRVVGSDPMPRRVVGGDQGVARREPIEVVLGKGLRVRVPGGFASEDLARVLAVLEGRGAC